VERAIGVGSGTDALELALRACGIGCGDEVITVSHTAVATVAAIELVGATPILVDIDQETFNIAPDLLAATIRARKRQALRAVIVVHLYGRCAPIEDIKDICTREGLWLIEDCAQSCGAGLRDKRTGTFGDVAAFSFYPTKNLGAFGDGGALVGAGRVIEDALLLRQYGWERLPISVRSGGMNSRLDELQAAMLRIKLGKLKRDNQRRKELAEIYDRVLAETSLVVPDVPDGDAHVFHQYVIRVTDRDQLRRSLSSNSVPTGVHYPVPIHRQPAYAGRVQIGVGGLAKTEKAASEVLSLPIHPFLSDHEIESVARLVAEFASS
jgi:dTDP-4-amino-4,6-dideoxygalactose transaminase